MPPIGGRRIAIAYARSRALWIDLAVVGAVVGAAWGHAGAAFALCLATRNVKKMMDKLEAATKVEPSKMRMAVSALALVMSIHWLACCWVMLSRPPGGGRKKLLLSRPPGGGRKQTLLTPGGAGGSAPRPNPGGAEGSAPRPNPETTIKRRD